MASIVGIGVQSVAFLNDTVTSLLTRVPAGIYASLTFALLAVLTLAIAAKFFAVFAWRESSWKWGSRLHYVATALAGLAFLWVLNHWNVLGYRFG